MIGGWSWYKEDPKGSNRAVMIVLITTLVASILYAIFFQKASKSKEHNKNIINKEAIDTLKKSNTGN